MRTIARELNLKLGKDVTCFKHTIDYQDEEIFIKTKLEVEKSIKPLF